MTHVQTGIVERNVVKVNRRILFGDFLAGAQKETIRRLHDGRLVHTGHVLASNRLGIVECIACDALAGGSSNELDALHDARNDLT